MVLPPVDHECSLQKIVTDLADRLAKLEQENAQLKKTLFGARSERSPKMPRVKVAEPATADEKKEKRRARAAEARAKTPTLGLEHNVPDSLRRCTACGRTDLVAMGQTEDRLCLDVRRCSR